MAVKSEIPDKILGGLLKRMTSGFSKECTTLEVGVESVDIHWSPNGGGIALT